MLIIHNPAQLMYIPQTYTFLSTWWWYNYTHPPRSTQLPVLSRHPSSARLITSKGFSGIWTPPLKMLACFIDSSGDNPSQLYLLISGITAWAALNGTVMNRYIYHSTGSDRNVYLTLIILRLLSSKALRSQNLWKPSKPCNVGTHLIALTKFSQMSTHLPGFQSFFRTKVPWSGIEPATYWLLVWHLTNWATLSPFRHSHTEYTHGLANMEIFW